MVAIIGVGFVGSAMSTSFKNKNIEVYEYDKYKDIGNIDECMKHDIIFLCLPTLFDEQKLEYDKSAIYEVVNYLKSKNYNGNIILKSTVEPGTSSKLGLIHNPEFLTARTAYEDFHNQTHIIIGGECNILTQFYKKYYPEAQITHTTSEESECIKLFCNSFYAVKVQFFTELNLLCKKNGFNYDLIKNTMLKNNWINPMHTVVPGPDGKISYGGACFPKDTNALYRFMEKCDSPHKILKYTIEERNSMRKYT